MERCLLPQAWAAAAAAASAFAATIEAHRPQLMCFPLLLQAFKGLKSLIMSAQFTYLTPEGAQRGVLRLCSCGAPLQLRCSLSAARVPLCGGCITCLLKALAATDSRLPPSVPRRKLRRAGRAALPSG